MKKPFFFSETKQVWLPFLFLSLFFYFTYHIFQGERGVLSWFRLHKIVEEKKIILHQLETEKEKLNYLVSLLSPNTLDLDMLEQQARAVLNFSHEDEVIFNN